MADTTFEDPNPVQDLVECILGGGQQEAATMFNTIEDLNLAVDIFLALPPYAQEACFTRAVLEGLRPAVLERLPEARAVELFETLSRPKRTRCHKEIQTPALKVKLFGRMLLQGRQCAAWPARSTSPPKSPKRTGSARHGPRTPHQKVDVLRQSLTGSPTKDAGGASTMGLAGDPLFDSFLPASLFGPPLFTSTSRHDPATTSPLPGGQTRLKPGEDEDMSSAPEPEDRSQNDNPDPPRESPKPTSPGSSPAPEVERSRGGSQLPPQRPASGSPSRKTTVEDALDEGDPKPPSTEEKATSEDRDASPDADMLMEEDGEDDEDCWADDDPRDDETVLKDLWSWMKEDPRSDEELAGLLPLESMEEYLQQEKSWRATDQQPYRPFSWRHARDKAKTARKGRTQLWAYATEWQWAMRIRKFGFEPLMQLLAEDQAKFDALEDKYKDLLGDPRPAANCRYDYHARIWWAPHIARYSQLRSVPQKSLYASRTLAMFMERFPDYDPLNPRRRLDQFGAKAVRDFNKRQQDYITCTANHKLGGKKGQPAPRTTALTKDAADHIIGRFRNTSLYHHWGRSIEGKEIVEEALKTEVDQWVKEHPGVDRKVAECGLRNRVRAREFMKQDPSVKQRYEALARSIKEDDPENLAALNDAALTLVSNLLDSIARKTGWRSLWLCTAQTTTGRRFISGEYGPNNDRTPSFLMHHPDGQSFRKIYKAFNAKAMNCESTDFEDMDMDKMKEFNTDDPVFNVSTRGAFKDTSYPPPDFPPRASVNELRGILGSWLLGGIRKFTGVPDPQWKLISQENSVYFMLDGIPKDTAGKGPIHIGEPSWISDNNIKALCNHITASAGDSSLPEDERFTFVGQRVHEAPPELDTPEPSTTTTKPKKARKASTGSARAVPARRNQQHRQAKDAAASKLQEDTESDHSRGSYAPSQSPSPGPAPSQPPSPGPAPGTGSPEPQPAEEGKSDRKKSVAFESPLPVRSPRKRFGGPSKGTGAQKLGAKSTKSTKSTEKGKVKEVVVDDVPADGKAKAKALVPAVTKPSKSTAPAKAKASGTSEVVASGSKPKPGLRSGDAKGNAMGSSKLAPEPVPPRMSFDSLREFSLSHEELDMRPHGQPWAPYNYEAFVADATRTVSVANQATPLLSKEFRASHTVTVPRALCGVTIIDYLDKAASAPSHTDRERVRCDPIALEYSDFAPEPLKSNVTKTLAEVLDPTKPIPNAQETYSTVCNSAPITLSCIYISLQRGLWKTFGEIIDVEKSHDALLDLRGTVRAALFLERVALVLEQVGKREKWEDVHEFREDAVYFNDRFSEVVACVCAIRYLGFVVDTVIEEWHTSGPPSKASSEMWSAVGAFNAMIIEGLKLWVSCQFTNTFTYDAFDSHPAVKRVVETLLVKPAWWSSEFHTTPTPFTVETRVYLIDDGFHDFLRTVPARYHQLTFLERALLPILAGLAAVQIDTRADRAPVWNGFPPELLLRDAMNGIVASVEKQGQYVKGWEDMNTVETWTYPDWKEEMDHFDWFRGEKVQRRLTPPPEVPGVEEAIDLTSDQEEGGSKTAKEVSTVNQAIDLTGDQEEGGSKTAKQVSSVAPEPRSKLPTPPAEGGKPPAPEEEKGDLPVDVKTEEVDAWGDFNMEDVGTNGRVKPWEVDPGFKRAHPFGQDGDDSMEVDQLVNDGDGEAISEAAPAPNLPKEPTPHPSPSGSGAPSPVVSTGQPHTDSPRNESPAPASREKRKGSFEDDNEPGPSKKLRREESPFEAATPEPILDEIKPGSTSDVIKPQDEQHEVNPQDPPAEGGRVTPIPTGAQSTFTPEPESPIVPPTPNTRQRSRSVSKPAGPPRRTARPHAGVRPNIPTTIAESRSRK